MVALLKRLLLVGATVSIGIAAPAGASEATPEVALGEFLDAAGFCMNFALPETDGGFREIATSSDWHWSESAQEYGHLELPVAVQISGDKEGHARFCEVDAFLDGEFPADEVVRAIGILVGFAPVEKVDHLLWVFGPPDAYRAMKIFQDAGNPQQIRLVTIVE